MTEAKNEVAVKDENAAALAAVAKQYGAVGAGENVDQKDIELKRLKLSQGTSDLVQEGKLSVGRYYNAADAQILGDNDSPAQMVIFYMDKVWMEFDVVWNEEKKKEERKFKTIVPVTKENADLPYKDEANNIARDFTFNFYMLSVKELEKGACIPYVFSMSRTQTKPAKNLNSKILEVAANGLPSFAYVFDFTSENKQKGEGDDLKKWQQVVVNVGRVAAGKELTEAARWLEIIKAQAEQIKVQGEEVAGAGGVQEEVPTSNDGDDDIPF